MLRWLTAGESHGPALVATIDGLPAGIEVTTADLARRPGAPPAGLRPRRPDEVRAGRGRVPRRGAARPDAGVGPIAIQIGNTEWPKWETVMAPTRSTPSVAAADDVNAEKEIARNAPLTRPRPGHADHAGMLKYGFDDARPVLERASARETAARVALGDRRRALPRQASASGWCRTPSRSAGATVPDDGPLPTADDVEAIDANPVRAFDPEAPAAMIAEIEAAHKDGDTLGGVVEVVVTGLPSGWARTCTGTTGSTPTRGRADGHPGHQGRRDRRRLPHRRAAAAASPTTRCIPAPTASSGAAPTGPAAPRAA